MSIRRPAAFLWLHWLDDCHLGVQDRRIVDEKRATPPCLFLCRRMLRVLQRRLVPDIARVRRGERCSRFAAKEEDRSHSENSHGSTRRIVRSEVGLIGAGLAGQPPVPVCRRTREVVLMAIHVAESTSPCCARSPNVAGAAHGTQESRGLAGRSWTCQDGFNTATHPLHLWGDARAAHEDAAVRRNAIHAAIHGRISAGPCWLLSRADAALCGKLRVRAGPTGRRQQPEPQWSH